MKGEGSHVEDAALSWLAQIDYAVGHGPHLAPGEPETERDPFADVILVARLRYAIRSLKPKIPEDAREDALRIGTPSLPQTNRAFQSVGDQFVFAQDYVFASPSTAAGVVQGRWANGRVDRKTEDGETFKDLPEAAKT